MIPVKIDEVRYRPPIITVVVIIICTFLFFKQSIVFIRSGLVPLDFVYTLLHPGNGIVQSVTVLFMAFFLHGSLLHLFGNMWYLWLFGSALENSIGIFRFSLLYLLFGIVSMLVQVASDPLSTVPIVGASGAIAGIMGMYFILKPFSKIIFWFPPLFFFRLFAFLFLLFWFWMQWYSIGTTQHQGSLVAWWAHISGFICGIRCALWLRLSKNFRRTTSRTMRSRR